ncbi:MAG TPA: hypothetical protein PLQ89_02820 [Phycisphaerae bacterium]|nr:hypothetical protein [Phycisphaerae bacterium]
MRRNPMYLLSAACMAVGARLYLVSPGTRAGDVGVVLLTLGIVQAYEWAVGGVLLTLHRWQRSPEDKPSLLLVTALFWTGPMAATAEMTAHRPVFGLMCAAGACAIALAELAVVHRMLGWRFSLSGRVAASACVVFLAAAPPLLRVPDSVSGMNEVFLYASWWLLAAIGLAGIAVVRHHARHWRSRGRNEEVGSDERASVRPYLHEFHLELAMLALAVGATAAHLPGMNYTYYGQPLRDPMGCILAAAALAWWFGYRRFGEAGLLPAGSAAMAWAAAAFVVLAAFALLAAGAAISWRKHALLAARPPVEAGLTETLEADSVV